MEAPKYGSYDYPTYAIAIGWSIAMVSLLPIPSLMIYRMCQTNGSFIQV